MCAAGCVESLLSRSPSSRLRAGLPGALCWFPVVLATCGRLVPGWAVARLCLAGCVGLLSAVFQTACFALGVFCCGAPMLGVFGFGLLSPALCLAGFVGLLSSSPPNGGLVRSSGVLGRGRPFGFGFGCPGCLGSGLTDGRCQCLACGHGRACCACGRPAYGRAWCAGGGPVAMAGRAMFELGPRVGHLHRPCKCGAGLYGACMRPIWGLCIACLGVW